MVCKESREWIVVCCCCSFCCLSVRHLFTNLGLAFGHAHVTDTFNLTFWWQMHDPEQQHRGRKTFKRDKSLSCCDSLSCFVTAWSVLFPLDLSRSLLAWVSSTQEKKT